jgi:hypothetical protein
MPVHLKPLYAYFLTSFVTPAGETRELKDPGAPATPRQLWRLNQAGLLALVQERPSISMGHAAGAIAYLERRRRRLIARLEEEARALEHRIVEVERDIRAHDAALAFIETGSWQEAARVAGYPDGSSARQAVEWRTDFLLVDPLPRTWAARKGRLAWLEGADERRRAGKAVPPC